MASTAFPPRSSSSTSESLFDSLLGRLAAEHAREVMELQREIKVLWKQEFGDCPQEGDLIEKPDIGNFGPKAGSGKSPTQSSPDPDQDLWPRSPREQVSVIQAPSRQQCAISQPRQSSARSVSEGRSEQAVSRTASRQALNQESTEDSNNAARGRSASWPEDMTQTQSKGDLQMVQQKSNSTEILRWQRVIDAVKVEIQSRDKYCFKPNPFWRKAMERYSQVGAAAPNKAGEIGALVKFMKQELKATASTSPDAMTGQSVVERSMQQFGSSQGGMTSSTASHSATFGYRMSSKTSNTKCVLHPASMKRMFWDFIGCAILLHDFIMIPMSVFEGGTTGLPEQYSRFADVFEWVTAAFWSLDIGLSFITGYHSRNGLLELELPNIAHNYFHTFFWIDAFVVLVDWCTKILNVYLNRALGDTGGYLRIGKTISRLMRVLRLLRLMKLSSSLRELMTASVNSELVVQVIGIGKVLVLIIFMNHYLACFWFAMAELSHNRPMTWARKALYIEDTPEDDVPSISYAYTTALHWSLTQFTPASMEVVPENTYERIYNIVVIVMALVIFSSFVSSITSYMTHMRNMNEEKSNKEAVMRSFFNEHKISVKLASRVWHFLHHNRAKVRPLVKQEDVRALDDVPQIIKDDIRQEVFTPILTVHPLFQQYLLSDPIAFRGTCIKAMAGVSLRSMEEACPAGHVQDLVFVVRGALCYIMSQETDATSTLGPTPSEWKSGITSNVLEVVCQEQHTLVGAGSWACEAGLWLSEAELQGPLIAASMGCEAFSLMSKEFQKVACRFESMNLLAQYALTFVEAFNLECESIDYDWPLFNDPDIIEDLVYTATQIANITNVRARDNQRTNLTQLFRTRLSMGQAPATGPGAATQAARESRAARNSTSEGSASTSD